MTTTLKKTIAVRSLDEDLVTLLNKLEVKELSSCKELDLSRITKLDDVDLGTLIDLLSKKACPNLMFLKFPPNCRKLEKAEIQKIIVGSKNLLMINNQWVICKENIKGLYCEMPAETMSIIREGIICPPILIAKIKETGKIIKDVLKNKRTLLFGLMKHDSNFTLSVAISGFDHEKNEELTTKLKKIDVVFHQSRAFPNSENSEMINEQENSLNRTKKIDIFKRLIRFARQNLKNESELSNRIFDHFGLDNEAIKDTLSNQTIRKIYQDNKKILNISLDEFFLKCFFEEVYEWSGKFEILKKSKIDFSVWKSESGILKQLELDDCLELITDKYAESGILKQLKLDDYLGLITDKYEEYRQTLIDEIGQEKYNEQKKIFEDIWTKFVEKLDNCGIHLLAHCAEDNFIEEFRKIAVYLKEYSDYPGSSYHIDLKPTVLFSIQSKKINEGSLEIMPPCEYCDTHYIHDLENLGLFGDLSFDTLNATIPITHYEESQEL